MRTKFVAILLVLISFFHLAEAQNRDYFYYGIPLDWGDLIGDVDDEDEYYEEDDEYDYEIYDDYSDEEFEGSDAYDQYYAADQLCSVCFRLANSKGGGISPYSSYLNGLDFQQIPKLSEDCACCDWDSPIYAGYLHFLYKGDFPFLKKQIALVIKDPYANQFWPEKSSKAAYINEKAIFLFKQFIDFTAYKRFKRTPPKQEDFFLGSWYFPAESIYETLHIGLCATCFHFSDYYQTCQDLKAYSKKHFSRAEHAAIEDRLENILDELALLFRGMYGEVLSVKRLPEIEQELRVIEALYNDWEMATICPACYPEGVTSAPKSISEGADQTLLFDIPFVKKGSAVCSVDTCAPNVKALSDVNPPEWSSVPSYLALGINYNDLFCYQEAVEILTTALAHDPQCLDAYVERAHAYFELGKFDLALADYASMRKLQGVRAKLLISSSPEYSVGLCWGVLCGSKDAAIEFGPATLNSCQGLLHGLWAFACSPAEVSQDLIDTSRALIQILREQSTLESLQMVVPEVCELCMRWDRFSEYEKGEKLGYVIGKYGLDILIPGAAIKAIHKFRAFRAANTVLTLERMAVSDAKRAAILNESAAMAAIRSQALPVGENLVLKNANKAKHIMAGHHKWDMVITVSGDHAEDCKRVFLFLEKHNVVSPVNLEKSTLHKGIIKHMYEKDIGAVRVRVYVEEHHSNKARKVENAFIVDPKNRKYEII